MLALTAHSLKLERYRDDYHGSRTRMTWKFVKRSIFLSSVFLCFPSELNECCKGQKQKKNTIIPNDVFSYHLLLHGKKDWNDWKNTAVFWFFWLLLMWPWAKDSPPHWISSFLSVNCNNLNWIFCICTFWFARFVKRCYGYESSR